MPRKPRFFLPNVPVHMVIRGNNRQSVFAETEDYLLACYRYIEICFVRRYRLLCFLRGYQFIEDSLDGEMDAEDYPESIWKKMMTHIKKRDIDPTILAKIKDEAAWEKAKNLENAKKMMKKGIELALVSDITQISLEELRKL